jgi:hypothetical protein
VTAFIEDAGADAITLTRGAMVREVPGRDKPAAVAADARDDEYGGGVKPSLCKIGKTATGVLHHLNELRCGDPRP